MLLAKDERQAAEEFVKTWQNKDGTEDQISRSFWLDLLQNVLGEVGAFSKIDFEKRVGSGTNRGRIDVYLPSTNVIIEQKSRGVDLESAFIQALSYDALLPKSEKANFIITCNFDEFHIYDLNLPNPTHQTPKILKLADLPKNVEMLRFLVDNKAAAIDPQKEISIQAAQLIGKLYDALLKQFGRTDDLVLKNLNKLCVRLVFCFYAEDSGVFLEKHQFGHYLKDFPANKARTAIQELFKILNTPLNKRHPSLEAELNNFPYVDGGLFAGAENDEIPPFNAEIFDILVKECSLGFDWSGISPTIFGAMFESTLNPDTRRQGGMHYTAVENIHKVIDPLFLSDLKKEFQNILKIRTEKNKFNALRNFQKKLASFIFLDPACGSGNFLTETYIVLRQLENKVLEILAKGNLYLSLGEEYSSVMVSLKQFYGIEINDFAVSVAQAAMWIAESQMLAETEKILGEKTPEFLPLKNHTNIVEGNALRMSWESLVPADKLDFIISNPPYAGARLMLPRQKEDLKLIAPNFKNIGNLDYVSGWFLVAVDLMDKYPNIKTAFVATNSICQGEHSALLWKPIFEKGCEINFAYPSFKWNSETYHKAQVYVVIVGFSKIHGKQKIIFKNNEAIPAKNINSYLKDDISVFIENRIKPFCDVPKIGIGNMPIDDGNFLFNEYEKEEFLKKEPLAEKFFRLYVGAEEFINNKKRYCLWLVDALPNELKQMPLVLERIKKVKEFRLKSNRVSTQKTANYPQRFADICQPETNYLLLPVISGENRVYLPIGFLPPEIIVSSANLIVPNATLYHFGILTSIVHNAWMRAVAGRLEMRYRYSKGIVYNNFIWPKANEKQKANIETLAQKVLDVRANYKNASLADLYDPLTMPADLQTAHKHLDAFVLKLYGFKPKIKENEIVAHLFQLYAQKTKEE